MPSVPNVPPDTMKKVAATSGHRVNLVVLFFAGDASDGNRVGGDTGFNSSRHPFQALLAGFAQQIERSRRIQCSLASATAKCADRQGLRPIARDHEAWALTLVKAQRHVCLTQISGAWDRSSCGLPDAPCVRYLQPNQMSTHLSACSDQGDGRLKGDEFLALSE